MELFESAVIKNPDKPFIVYKECKESSIKDSGFQVCPNEIKQVILTRAGIYNCVVGSASDKKQGEKVVALIVKKPD